MADVLQGPAASLNAAQIPPLNGRDIYQRLRRRRILGASAVLASWVALIVSGYFWLRYVQPLYAYFPDMVPRVAFINGRMLLPMPNGNLAASVGSYSDELTAYLHFDYVKGIQSLAGLNVFLVTREVKGTPLYTLYVQMPNDLLVSGNTLAKLVGEGYIRDWDLNSPPTVQILEWEKETSLFDAAYRQPVQEKLLQLPRDALTSAVASFILFKVRTDRRVRMHLEPADGKELTSDDARDFAADMISVAEFYQIPLDMLLGIGAMENNYLDVRGDLQLAVWKRRAEPGDIVLRRRHGRVLVSDYSVGPWQITRETLRYAHELYLRDRAHDYNQLPERLRPPRKLDFDHVSTGVLTTYAGLLLRHLLDYFHGDVQLAEGAYNGGRGDPNPKYSAGVEMVASYARQMVGMAAGRKGNAVSETSLVVAKNPIADAVDPKSGDRSSQAPAAKVGAAGAGPEGTTN
ncbi:MAG TPA: hypothetical protein VF730_13775 [Terracidiphilus sp.]